jgi:hypothetical protein
MLFGTITAELLRQGLRLLLVRLFQLLELLALQLPVQFLQLLLQQPLVLSLQPLQLPPLLPLPAPALELELELELLWA